MFESHSRFPSPVILALILLLCAVSEAQALRAIMIGRVVSDAPEKPPVAMATVDVFFEDEDENVIGGVHQTTTDDEGFFVVDFTPGGGLELLKLADVTVHPTANAAGGHDRFLTTFELSVQGVLEAFGVPFSFEAAALEVIKTITGVPPLAPLSHSLVDNVAKGKIEVVCLVMAGCCANNACEPPRLPGIPLHPDDAMIHHQLLVEPAEGGGDPDFAALTAAPDVDPMIGSYSAGDTVNDSSQPWHWEIQIRNPGSLGAGVPTEKFFAVFVTPNGAGFIRTVNPIPDGGDVHFDIHFHEADAASMSEAPGAGMYGFITHNLDVPFGIEYDTSIVESPLHEYIHPNISTPFQFQTLTHLNQLMGGVLPVIPPDTAVLILTPEPIAALPAGILLLGGLGARRRRPRAELSIPRE